MLGKLALDVAVAEVTDDLVAYGSEKVVLQRGDQQLIPSRPQGFKNVVDNFLAVFPYPDLRKRIAIQLLHIAAIDDLERLGVALAK